MVGETTYRSLELRQVQPDAAGSEPLDAVLVDPSSKGVEALGVIQLPSRETMLADGLSVGKFLEEFGSGQPYYADEGLKYGQLLSAALFPRESKLRDAWNRTFDRAKGKALRFEVVLPREPRGLKDVPFELLV